MAGGVAFTRQCPCRVEAGSVLTVAEQFCVIAPEELDALHRKHDPSDAELWRLYPCGLPLVLHIIGERLDAPGGRIPNVAEFHRHTPRNSRSSAAVISFR